MSCGNAINFEDFIKNVLFEHADSKLMIDGHVGGTCNLIKRNLEELPINMIITSIRFITKYGNETRFVHLLFVMLTFFILALLTDSSHSDQGYTICPIVVFTDLLLKSILFK